MNRGFPTARVKEPSSEGGAAVVKPNNHEDCEFTPKRRIFDKGVHSLDVSRAWLNRERRMAVPLSDIVELGIAVTGSVKEPDGFTRCLDQIDDAIERDLLLDVLFDPAAPWTVLAATEDDSVLRRCDRVHAVEHGQVYERNVAAWK